jgi:HK97 family phage portal protein
VQTNKKPIPLKYWIASRLVPAKQRAAYLQSVNGYLNGGGWAGAWWPGAILESYTGAWQHNVVAAPTSTLLSFSPVYACVTGIANDIGKIRIKLSRVEDGIWTEITENQPWLPLLRDPNHYQDLIQFLNSWMLSKLMYGNTYVLKQRDKRKVVQSLYVLHPGCVKPLVSDDGGVYYELTRDDLSGIHESTLAALTERYGRIAIPASEIIHDRFNTLWHPLVGVSPLYACGNSATLGTTIINNSTKFFTNASRPSGHLTAPGAISDETAGRLKANFESSFGGDNIGKLLVTGDGLTYEAFDPFDAQKSQTKEQIDAAVEDVSRAFRYPIWKLTGSTPPYTKPDQAETLYFSSCLQPHVTAIESCLRTGLELPLGINVEFDLDELMRMDTQALYESNNAAKGWMTPDEQRYRANLPALSKGGDTVYLQHQDYPIEVIADRKDLSTATAQPAVPQVAPEPARAIETQSPDELSLDKLAEELEMMLVTK